MNDSIHDPAALEHAAVAARHAEQAARIARKQLSAAIVSAYLAGERVASPAARTGESPHQIRNLLDAAGARTQVRPGKKRCTGPA
ncbi:hypothetical protein [Streptomyces sp. NPDC096030]|uniref:hypothetical protein n=1 Tax=Streptomyces sp. NPDC096030 TaxID=3155423 RepID=UPI00331DA7C7